MRRAVEDEYGKRPGALPEGVHRPRPALGLWVRTTAAIACTIGGILSILRGAATAEGTPWIWAGITMVILGIVGIFLARWMYRRNR